MHGLSATLDESVALLDTSLIDWAIFTGLASVLDLDACLPAAWSSVAHGFAPASRWSPVATRS